MNEVTLSRIKNRLSQRAPRLYEGLKALLPRTRRRKNALRGRAAQDVFSEIYKENLWGSAESRSGLGSTVEATAQLRESLPPLLNELDVRVLLDAPCGDFNWMQHVDLNGIEYVGGDIVPGMVRKLQMDFETTHRRFILFDILADPFPDADALLCRDLFLHFSFTDIERALDNFRKSSCRYLITSTYPTVRLNPDILTGEVRPLNFLAEPFNWCEPMRELVDNIDQVLERRLGVWHRDQLPR